MSFVSSFAPPPPLCSFANMKLNRLNDGWIGKKSTLDNRRRDTLQSSGSDGDDISPHHEFQLDDEWENYRSPSFNRGDYNRILSSSSTYNQHDDGSSNAASQMAKRRMAAILSQSNDDDGWDDYSNVATSQEFTDGSYDDDKQGIYFGDASENGGNDGGGGSSVKLKQELDDVDLERMKRSAVQSKRRGSVSTTQQRHHQQQQQFDQKQSESPPLFQSSGNFFTSDSYEKIEESFSDEESAITEPTERAPLEAVSRREGLIEDEDAADDFRMQYRSTAVSTSTSELISKTTTDGSVTAQPIQQPQSHIKRQRPRIPTEQIDQIKSTISLVDVIETYNLPSFTRTNSHIAKACCPFHDDNNPSMSIDDNRGLYKCFACGAGGDVFNFIREYDALSSSVDGRKKGEKMGYMQAVEYAAKEFGDGSLVRDWNFGEGGGGDWKYEGMSKEKKEQIIEREKKKDR